MFETAIARRPAATLAQGLTTASMGSPHPRLAQEQHRAYVTALRELGVAVQILEPDERFPDGHFVEDTAVVTADVAVLSRPGASQRRGEAELMAPVLETYRPVERIDAPGTLDGGDVLLVGYRALVGISERTNEDGARQLARILEDRDWKVTLMEVGEGLHLKSGVNALSDDMLLVTPGFAGRPEIEAFRTLVVPQEEEYAANTLLVNGHLLVPRGFPATLELLHEAGLPCHEVETSEFRKMDGGLTCLSLRF